MCIVPLCFVLKTNNPNNPVKDITNIITGTLTVAAIIADKNIIKKIMTEGIEELNERTGHKIKILPGVTFQIDVEKDGFPLLTLRKIPL